MSEVDDYLAGAASEYRLLKPDDTLARRIRTQAHARLQPPVRPTWRWPAGFALSMVVLLGVAVWHQAQHSAVPSQPSVRLPAARVTVALPPTPSQINIGFGRLRVPASVPSPSRPANTDVSDTSVDDDTTSNLQLETFDAPS